MKSETFLKISGMILALLAIAALTFLSFPGRMIHPEDFSPIGYLIAFLLSWLAIRRLSKGERKWGYWLYAAFAFFLGLEEISFGVENEWVSSIYIDFIDLEIYDLHNLVPVSLRRIGAALGIELLSETILIHFLRFDLLIVTLSVFLLFAFRQFRRGNKLGAGPRIIPFISLLSGLISLWALLSLAGLPSDPKNEVILGYSMQRFLPMLGVALFGLAAFTIAMMLNKSRFLKRLEQWLNAAQGWLKRLVWVGLTIALVLQFLLSVNVDEQSFVRLVRIDPLLSWGLLQLTLLYLVGLVQNEMRFDRLLARPKQFWGFLDKYPASIFAIYAIALVGFAQLLDKDWISVAYLFEGSQLWVNNWNLFIEEYLEAAGGILLAAGTFYFQKGQ